MIDWLNLGFNALWIIACAIALACGSYASWQASERGTRLRDEIAAPPMQLILNTAGMLFSVGLAGTADRTYEIVLWLILALLFLIQMVLEARTLRKGDLNKGS